MKITKVEELWIHYLYAFKDGIYNDVDDFITRMDLIHDAKEEILKTMLEDMPNMELVKECKEEITFQKENLKELMCEFMEFVNTITISETDVSQYFFESNSFYDLAIKYKSLGDKVHTIYDKIIEISDYEICYIFDDFCKLILDIPFWEEWIKQNKNYRNGV